MRLPAPSHSNKPVRFPSFRGQARARTFGGVNQCFPAPAPDTSSLRPVPTAAGLYERDGELDALAGALSTARFGEGALVVLDAPAGLGKTALLEQAATIAAEAGFAVHRSAPGPLERGFPYGVVRTLLEAPLHSASGAERERLLDGAAGLAGRLLLGAGLPGGDASTMIAHSVFWLCTALSREQPLALLVDDAQWADRDSLAVLSYLARRIQELPLLLIVASRAGDPDAPSDMIGLLTGARCATVLRPRRLSVLAGISVVREHAPESSLRSARDAHSAAGGVPWLLHEAGRALAGEPVSPAVRHRLFALAPRDRGVAAALAVLRVDAPPHVVAGIAGLDLAELSRARDALSAAGLLAPAGLRIAHGVIAEAIAAQLPGAERDHLHREAARRLAAAGAPAGVVAEHLLECGPDADPEVSRLLRSAAVDAAPADAAAYLERALAEHAPEDDRGRMLASLGAAEFDAGREGSRERLHEALRELRDRDDRLDVLVRLAGMEALAGPDGDVLALLAEDAGDPAVAVAVLDALIERPELRAAELAGLEQADVLDHGVLAHRAWTAVQRGSAPAAASASLALEALEGGVLLADAGRRAGYHLAVRTLIATDRHEAARRAIDALAAVASVPLHAAAAWYEAELGLRTGDVTGAADAARRALELAPADLRAVREGATGALARALAEKGELDEARELVGTGEPTPALCAAAARVALLAGDYAEAARLAREPWPEPSDRLVVAALALAHLGRRDQAVKFADEALARAERTGAPVSRVATLHARAVAEADAGARRELLERALAVAGGVAAVLETTRVRLELGATLSRSGARTAAREAFRPALADADAVGAVPLAERARRELVATGLRPRQAAVEGAAALTPRQREICELAARGKGNREIAQALFLSVKTVETHLAAGYRKLGIASRADLGPALGAAA
jgi:DNA-binding CsgD family transcriptional regulator